MCDPLPAGLTLEQCNSYQSVSSNIDSLKEIVENQIVAGITSGPGTATYKTNQRNKLLTQYTAAQQNLKNAPQDLSNAEKSYYVYNEGEPGGNGVYDSIIIDRYAKTADEFKKNSIDKQQQFMTELSQILKQYQAEQLFVVRANELLKDRVEENEQLNRSLSRYEAIIQTNERKVVYEISDMDGLYLYRRIMVFIYYSALTIYIVFGNFIPEKKYESFSAWVIVIILALIPIILNRVIKWLYILKEYIGYWLKEIPHKDVMINL
jgi:hypothetical protein